MARKPRHTDRDRLPYDNAEPYIIEMDKPGLNWVPLRFAPQRYQSISEPFGKRTLTGDAIEAFVLKTVKDPSIVECTLESFTSFSIHCSRQVGKEEVTEFVHVAPYAPREWTDSYDGTTRPAYEPIVDVIVAVWAQMEARFRTAHRLGDCRILARYGSPVAEHFTAVTPDAFAAFTVIDWKNGIAQSVTGDRLYSIHAASPSKHDQKALGFIREFERSPLKLQVGQYLYLHHRNGLVGHKVTASIIKKIREHCFGKALDNRLDEKTIRDAYKLFRDLLSSRPSTELLDRIEFRSVKPRRKNAAGSHGQTAGLGPEKTAEA
jgi:hypothetical protein